ncbi:YARHG domain-containing protein [Flammeovirga sp. MY04]|uniref:YARHG domain-containing protein n=1 Tax=Flammeovirga sp. MY04 TaxID=1191459 RepID=UPI00080616AE|nr:YARHG domain-containing protein [Flammeovirga sp. MY04]ANQ48114.1 YARHG domain-containing protein [Flammeovirga sp. MY04]
MKTLLLLPLLFISSILLSQTMGMEEIEHQDISIWETTSVKDYGNVYHFGDSEWEYSLVIIVLNPSNIIAYKVQGHFNDNATAWIHDYEHLNDVKIEGSKFYSKEFNGEFATYKGKTKGLKMFDENESFTSKEYEFGYLSYTLEQFFQGKFSTASYVELDKSTLQQFDKSDLQIMRNEIFARYGYIFKKGGKMESYFTTQEWYSAEHKNVNSFLTTLEKRNIKLIQEVESTK